MPMEYPVPDPLDVEQAFIEDYPIHDLSQFSSFQDAVDSVGEGETILVPPGDFRTSDWGRVDTDRVVRFLGTGAGYSRTADDLVGSRIIIDDGAGTPVFDIHNVSGANPNYFAGTFEQIGFKSEVDAPAILFDNCWQPAVDKCFFHGNGTQTTAVQVRNKGEEGWIKDSMFHGLVGTSIDIDVSSITFTVRGVTINNGATDTPEIKADFVDAKGHFRLLNSFLGGQSDGIGVEILGSTDYGHEVKARFNLLKTAIKLGNSSYSAEETRIHDCWFNDISDYVVDFFNTLECSFKDPLSEIVNGSTSGVAFKLGDTGAGTTAVADYIYLPFNSREADFQIDDKYRTKVRYDAVFNDTQRGQIPTPIEGTEIYNTTDGNLNIYNGTDWILPDGTVT